MKTRYNLGLRGLIVLLFGLTLAACGEQDKTPVSLDPVAHAADECDVCGMGITDFPGPKDQAVEKDGDLHEMMPQGDMHDVMDGEMH